MEEYEPAKPPIINEENTTPQFPENPNNNKIIENKNYIFYLDKEAFSLNIETYTNGKIIFKVRQGNNISSYFTKTYSFEEILQTLFLFKNHHENITKILKYIDTSISQNKMVLISDKINNKLKLSLKKTIDNEEVEFFINLEEVKLTNDDLLKIILNDIKELKSKEKENNNNQNINNTIKELQTEMEKIKKENAEMKAMIQKLTQEKNKEKSEMLEKIMSLIEDNRKMKDMLKKIKNNTLFQDLNNNNFNQNPNNLKFKELLTSNHSSAGMLSNFAVFTGIKDNISYLIYNNKANFNLEVMRLNDNTIVHYLQKHTNKVTVIKYYNNIKSEEFLLSCDANKLVIIWDIQNNYCIKSIIQEQFQGTIWDALILFNIFNKDFILLSSGSKGVPIRLYEFKENNSPFINWIPETEQNCTNYMIPWFNNNKYYIIKLYNGISIHNLFGNECYAKLTASGDRYYCGFIYKKNYLCANDRNNKILRIWDLINKNIYKEIKYDGEIGKEIIPWNDTYTIIACNHCFIIVDIEKGKETNKITVEKSCLGGVKKIYLNNFGECLIAADFNNNIELFSL